jgi:outer membrane protein
MAGVLFSIASLAAAQTTPAPTPAVADIPTTPVVATAPVRIAFVDLDLALSESKAVFTLLSEIDEGLQRQERELTARKREVRRLEIELERQGPILSDTERARRQSAILDAVEEIERLETRFQREVRDKERTTVGPLRRRLMEVVAEVGRREGYDLVLNGEMVLFGRERIDLTPAVIAEMDRRAPELRRLLLPPAAAADTTPTPTPAP